MYTSHRIILKFIVITFLLSACSTKKNPFLSKEALKWETTELPDDEAKVHTLYLIGDTGEVDDEETNSNMVVDRMAEMMNMEDKNSSVVFLGDNVYPIGLVDEKEKIKRIKGQNILHAQLDPLIAFKGQTYLIPGNHDWNKDKKGGLESIKRQEAYVEKNFGGKGRVHFYPKMGCGDPKVVKINKEVVYIFIDSQWWLQNWSNEIDINHGCEITSRGDFLKRMEELFLKYKNKEIICMLHHPIKSNGNHGGYFSLKQHLFPLAELGVWIPLPIIGSLYPIYRQATGSVQDNTNIKNQNLTKGLETMAKLLRVNVVFASGHEHGLEFFQSSKIKYIVSGSGSKTSYIRSGGDAEYARQARGFARITFYKNFESWLEFFTIKEDDQKPKLEYRVQLRTPRAGTVEDDTVYPPIMKPDTTYAANEAFHAGGFKKMMMGKQYRDMWTTPVKAELVNLEKKLGGLTPIKKGGGMSSNSLRMEHDSGKQYILRSIKKDYRKLVPEGFENLKVLDIMKDQNSASHPYAALVIPSLSKAADIYYTEPELIYLKHQKGLGNYNSQFPEELYLLEERPSGDWSDEPKFGNAKEIIGYTDLLKNLRTKKHHRVDQEWVLKSRIFDLWIHDWDRHDDQWRWAKFKEDDFTTYRPIPRDRDQAFYKFVGLVPTIVSTFLLKKFKTMKHDVGDVKNLAFNAQHFDRHFLNELEWSEWQPIIQKLQDDVKDNVIEGAMLKIPIEVQQTDNADIISKLKSRRGHLEKIGKKLYDFLSEEVEIVGSDNEDLFVINHLEDGSTKISAYVIRNKKDNIIKYERTFYPTETKEVRIYGLRGKDRFEVNGFDDSKIKIRIIGGEDDDTLVNNTDSGRLFAYDDINGIKMEGKIIDKTSNNYLVNEYNRNEFKYDTGLPLLNFGSTQDDGFWIGGGYSWTNFGWRKNPYKSKNVISFSVAPGSQNAIQFRFQSDNVDALGNLDIIPEASINFPRYENYFGLGNNSVNPQREIQFNWVKLQTIEAKLTAKANINNAISFSFGPIFQSQDINLTEGRVSNDSELGFEPLELERRNYIGVSLKPSLKYMDNATFPTNGLVLDVNFSHLKEVSKDENVTELDLSIKGYVRLLARPKLVFANALGYKKGWGDRQFHQYADLGNTTNLRGFRNNRFRGDAAFYHNLDLRMHIYDWDNTWLPMEIGILGGYDYGKVWLEGESDNIWHRSNTIGIWMNILNLAVIQPHYTFVGEGEGDIFSLLMGFNF